MAVEMDGVIAIDRLRDHYKHCIRLSASNKINPKNAFDLQLIDYMQDLVSNGEDGQMNFKIASSALDVGAKIYSNRVDCIQSEAQKVASSILMALDGQQAKNNENPDDSHVDGNTSANSDSLNESREGGDQQSKASKKKRPTRNKNVKTIVEDENLLDAKLEKMVLGDAFLDGLSQDFDMSCPAALISYNALTQPSCLLTIESSHLRKDYRELPITSTQPAPEHNFVTLITKTVNCAQIIRNNQTNHICPRLDNFLFNDTTTTISGLNSNLDSSIQQQNNDEKISSSKPSGGTHEFNPELYNANDDYGDDHVGDSDSIGGDVENHQENEDENDLIPNLDKIAASKPTDYGYSNEHHRLLNTWAGPHAWKIMKIPQSTKKDALLKSAKKRVKLEQKPIEFEEEFSKSLEQLTDKEIRHSADVIRRWKKPLRPQDHNLTEESVRKVVFKSLIRPEDTYHCMKTPAEASKLVDIDHDYTKTDNNADVDEAPTSPGLAGFDDVHDDSDDEFRADPLIDGNEVAIYGTQINNTLTQQADLEFAGEHLIEQPYTVAQVNIPFAKIAKKMDVRKLKRIMWDLLLPEESRSEENHNESAIHLEFSNLYGEVPVRVSSKMANDLSQPIAFVTLLHLANEKNLKLIPSQDLKDFMIEQD